MKRSDAQSADTAGLNQRFVIDHIETFVNRRDMAAIDRTMAADFLDQDGPGGKPTGVDGDCVSRCGMPSQKTTRWQRATVTPLHERTASKLEW
jgi:hypothetical protein